MVGQALEPREPATPALLTQDGASIPTEWTTLTLKETVQQPIKSWIRKRKLKI